MKIYFNGCSWTWGAKLSKEKKIHISDVVCPNNFSLAETRVAVVFAIAEKFSFFISSTF